MAGQAGRLAAAAAILGHAPPGPPRLSGEGNLTLLLATDLVAEVGTAAHRTGDSDRDLGQVHEVHTAVSL